MEIISSRHYVLVLRDGQGNTSDVFQQGDGRFKCLRCNRYRCEHVKFVQASGQVPPRPTQDELAKNAPDILTF